MAEMNIRSEELPIKNQEVILDFTHFKNTEFENCTLIYYGSGHFRMSNCSITGCDYQFRGPAKKTLDFLAAKWRLGMRALILNIFQKVTDGDLVFTSMEIDEENHLVADLGVFAEDFDLEEEIERAKDVEKGTTKTEAG